MRDKLQRFMMGRYGLDQFGKFLTWGALGILVIAMFTRVTLLEIPAVLMLVYGYFRMFSKNTYKRYNENMKFMGLFNKVKWFFDKKKRNLQTRKTHHIYACPKCRQKIKIPKGKGRIMVRCPKCGQEFEKNS